MFDLVPDNSYIIDQKPHKRSLFEAQCGRLYQVFGGELVKSVSKCQEFDTSATSIVSSGSAPHAPSLQDHLQRSASTTRPDWTNHLGPSLSAACATEASLRSLGKHTSTLKMWVTDSVRLVVFTRASKSIFLFYLFIFRKRLVSLPCEDFPLRRGLAVEDRHGCRA